MATEAAVTVAAATQCWCCDLPRTLDYRLSRPLGERLPAPELERWEIELAAKPEREATEARAFYEEVIVTYGKSLECGMCARLHDWEHFELRRVLQAAKAQGLCLCDWELEDADRGEWRLYIHLPEGYTLRSDLREVVDPFLATANERRPWSEWTAYLGADPHPEKLFVTGRVDMPPA